MKWNPLLNAASAAAYIGAVVLFMHFITSLRHDTPDTLLDGMGALSLATFSAAVMAFLFFYRPVLLLIEKKAGRSTRLLPQNPRHLWRHHGDHTHTREPAVAT